MRIVHVIYDDMKNPWCGGGGAVRAYEVNRRLARRHEVTVVTGNYPGARDEVIDGIRYIRVGRDESYLLSRISFSFEAPIKLKGLRYDILIDDFSPFSPCFAPFYSRSPVITLLQNYFGYHSLRKYPVIGVISLLFERLNLKVADFVITVSPWLEREIRGKVKRNTLIRCILNGIDDRWFKMPDVEGEGNYILFIGRIDFYHKGIDTLVKAFAEVSAEVPGVVLKIVGRGREEDVGKTLRLIDKLNLGGRVELVGPVYDFEKKFRLFARSKFVCIPSRFEGWPIVSIEAGAAGKAVVGTKIPAFSAAVRDGETGLLVPPDNPDELAEAMIYLLKREEERRRLGENGRRWARSFNWDDIAKEQEQFYLEVLDLEQGRRGGGKHPAVVLANQEDGSEISYGEITEDAEG